MLSMWLAGCDGSVLLIFNVYEQLLSHRYVI
jgi:hypothetical protein